MTPRQAQEKLCRLIADARAINTRPFEHAPYEMLLQDLVPAGERILAQAIDTLSHIFNLYESGRGEPFGAQAARDETFLGGIDRVMTTGRAAERVADLCFMARIELRAKQLELKGLVALKDPWRAISACASARRKLIKSCSAIEIALAEHEGLPPGSRGEYETELQTAREVRHAYTQFRKAVTLPDATPSPQDIRPALRLAGVQIAKLVGKDVYEDLRVDDRMQLRSLQDRILGWMRGMDGFAARSGLRLLQDLSTFAGILVLVNNRSALRDHDGLVIREALGTLAALPARAPVPPSVLSRLRELRGRDDELDRALEPGSELPAAVCCDLLRRVLESLAMATQPEAPVGRASHPGELSATDYTRAGEVSPANTEREQ